MTMECSPYIRADELTRETVRRMAKALRRLPDSAIDDPYQGYQRAKEYILADVPCEAIVAHDKAAVLTEQIRRRNAARRSEIAGRAAFIVMFFGGAWLTGLASTFGCWT